MSKRGKLTDIEKETIIFLTQQGYNTTEIASVINRTPTSVKKYLDTTNIVEDPPDTPQEPQPTDRAPTAKDFMINRTIGKKDKSVSIMTKEASARGDEHRLKIHEPNRLAKKAIHRIDENG